MADITAQVTVREGQGYLTGIPSTVMEQLRNAASFRPGGFYFSKAYNTWVPGRNGPRRKWDGHIRLLKNSKFPAGLLDRVVTVLNANDVEFELSVESPGEFPDLNIGLGGIEERDYQDSAVEAALIQARGILRAPTGSGKTAIGARIIAGRRKRALVVVPTIDLLHQYRGFLGEHLVLDDGTDGNIGQLGDGVVDPRNVTVATVRTAAKAMGVAYESYEYGEYDDKDDTPISHTAKQQLREWVDGIGTLIVDEAHILGAQTVYDLATRLKAPNKYGMSASPWRDDGADLMIEAATGPVIYRIDTGELVRDGWLVPPVIRTVVTKDWWRAAAWDKGQWAACYKQEIVDNQIRNLGITGIVEELEGATLVLVKQINHGRVLERLIEESVFLSGKDSGLERQRVYDKLRWGGLRVVIATTIADLGLDLPICRNLVLAGGGKSSTRHLQRIGRVARPFPGKQNALVIDFDDSHISKWFADHVKARRKIEGEEWRDTAIWI